MIGMRTRLEVADNSGARRLRCILPRGGDTGVKAGLGDVVMASVQEAAPDSNVKKGAVVRAVIVRMRKETRRRDGSYIRFDNNAAVLINELGEPIGTRVFGPSGPADRNGTDAGNQDTKERHCAGDRRP
jgi:large subunit ribosomal protein L14